MPDDNLPMSVRTAEPITVGFANSQSFEFTQRAARALAASTLVPEQFRSVVVDKKSKNPVENSNAIPNCIIALNMANRMGADPLMVMQNLYVVEGRPSWSAQFVIAAINSCGRFSPLRFDLSPPGDEREVSYEVTKWINGQRTSSTAKCIVRDRTCQAWAIEKATGERLDGPEVSIAMAEAEGWLTKNGSKWQTMPEVMLRYRSAAFFGRLYAPELLMGLQTAEEAHDSIIDITPAQEASVPRPTRAVVEVQTTGAGSAYGSEGDGESADGAADADPFLFVDADGVEHSCDTPMDWSNRLFAALKAAGNAKIADGLWETNSSQLARFRAEVEDGDRYARVIEDAYGEALKKGTPAAGGDASQPKGARPNAPRELGKIPRTGNGTFDWVKACQEFGDCIETAESLDDIRGWQEKNIARLDNMQKQAPEAYAMLQKRIQATAELLGAAQD